MSSVYYIRCGGAGGLIKIGTAVDPRKRLSQLQTGNGETLSLLAVEPGGLDIEGRRHRQFRAYRARGEWFRAEPALLEHIEAVKAGTPEPIRLSAGGALIAVAAAAWLFVHAPVLTTIGVAALVFLRWFGWRNAGYAVGWLVSRLLRASSRLVRRVALLAGAWTGPPGSVQPPR